jgi:cyclophilin family peptidyl-prolyl cis-trans isomerase/HEAT repeat protein
MKTIRLIFFLLPALIASCSQPNKFSDPIIQTISNLQDHRQADSLQKFLLDKNPKYRAAAALAFASLQDSAASLQLGNMLLEDPSGEARTAAAFALGQTVCFASCNALIAALQEKDTHVLREVLEALGKTIRKEDLSVLKKFHPSDSLSQIGVAWAHYQLGLRGLADLNIIAKQAEYLKANYPTNARLAAAHFFNRTQNININNQTSAILQATKDRDVFVRMAAVNAARKLDSAVAIDPLLVILKNDLDYRVRVAAAQAVAGFSSHRANKLLLTALRDKNVNVGVAIVEKLKPAPPLFEAILTQANQTNHWRIRTHLFRLALALKPNRQVENEVQQKFKSSQNEYEKANYVMALASQPTSFPFLSQVAMNASSVVVKTAAAQALILLNQSTPNERDEEFVATYRDLILQGDPGVIGIISSALKEFRFKKIIKDYSFLTEAKSKLQLPKHIEALQPLEEAIAYFKGEEQPPQLKIPFNHPIDWKMVNQIAPGQQVKIQTSKGEITLQLLVEEAPGSVANFVSLVNQKYFDGKNFHRVVPNFVVQGGCNRGDGFGSEAYSIRSEFGLRRYTEGSVGMASAGKDTEGTQWFITHSPTPHLDGRYTIVATVLHGMEVVHTLEVGDKIISVHLIK